MSRLLTLLFGVTGYAIFFATFLYLIGFVSGLIVPITVDGGGTVGDPLAAVLIDVALIGLFGVQHTIMARPAFKRWWTTIVPEPIERTIFMLVTCAIFATMFWCWRPIDTVLWSLPEPLASTVLGVGFLGWGIVLLSTFLIDHFDLFGLRQTWLAFRGQPYTQKPFQERSLYRFVRHPLMFGFLLAFWAAPTMTASRLVFAATYTVYIVLALFIEERDLVGLHGNAYREYQRRVPKLLPLGRPARGSDPIAVAE
ncbi:MAG: isoprenylcysteine carboxylmethyltransferase family protein [Planctomycetes bacterium]|nr:isoprenylcysteine carboxylmethyltransferase family protein [Planctomycetota bacterium]